MHTIIYILVLPFIASLISYFLGIRDEKLRDTFNVLFTAIEFLLIIMLYPEIIQGPVEYMMPNIMGTGLHLKVDILRYAMLFISGLTWLLTTLYSTQYLIKYKNRNRYYLFFMLTYATTLGVFMSANILNLFTFFEGMSFTSYILVIHDEDQYSHQAGRSYLSMAIAGGMVMLLGIFLAFDYTSTLELTEIGQKLSTLGPMKYGISFLIMFGFMIKASVFPLHTWLPKAYPAAPAPASAILSAILLKTGLFGLIIMIVELFQYDLNLSMTLYVLGIINIFLGGALALIQRNIKRIIAYSSMSQTGFMLIGIGLIGILGKGGGLALVGTILYMINHALIISLLFLGVGLIYMIFDDLSLNFIQGFGRGKHGLKTVFFVGLLGVCGVPGFNGYISKTLLHEAIIEASHLTHSPFLRYTEYLFLIGGGITVAYMLKLFIAVFVDKNPKFHGQYKDQVSKRALIPMAVLACLIIIIGLFPQYILSPLMTYAESIGMRPMSPLNFYSKAALLSSALSVSLGLLIYLYVVKKILIKKTDALHLYINPSTHWTNLEQDIYIPVFKTIFHIFSMLFKWIDNLLLASVKAIAKFFELLSKFDRMVVPKLEWKEWVVDTRVDLITTSTAKEKASHVQENFKRLINKKSAETIQLKSSLYSFFSMASSVTSSIFLIGFVIVFSLIYVFIIH